MNIESIKEQFEIWEDELCPTEVVRYLLSIIEQSRGDENNNAFWKLYDRFEDKIAEKLILKDKLEQADTALSRIADLHIRGIEDRAAEPHREIAKEALKVLRGN